LFLWPPGVRAGAFFLLFQRHAHSQGGKHNCAHTNWSSDISAVAGHLSRRCLSLQGAHTHIILIAYNMHSELRGLIKRKKKRAGERASERESRDAAG
jgi:hypothetical protein